MIKLQKFDVYSFNFIRLKNNGYDLKITPEDAYNNEEVISLGDSEVLRVIRRVSGHSFNEEEFKSLLQQRKEISKRRRTEEDMKNIKNIRMQLLEQIFIPEYVSVTTEKKGDYRIIGKNGFKLNGEKYVRLLCGASHSRTNRTIFIKEKYYDKVNNILKNGVGKVSLMSAKYNAYYSLSSSSTYRVTSPRVCVVPDREDSLNFNVDFVTEVKDGDDIIERQNKDINVNQFDGMGIISVELSKKWAEELEVGYIPSAFCVRCIFIKGMVATFDFHKFAEKVAKKDTIIDVYGKEYKIKDIDMIITQSQFKLFAQYSSYEEYMNNINKNGVSWGVSRVSPQHDKNYIRTNYQFVQVLSLSDENIKNLCEPTVSWIRDVSEGDVSKMCLYLLGKTAHQEDPKKVYEDTQDYFIKSMMLCPDLIKDPYIYNRVIQSLNKKIRESYIGKLLIRGNFQVRIADPYALCEHIFDMEVKGLLKRGEHYCSYWNNNNTKQVVAMRSPLTWRSEAHILNLQDNFEVNEWYKYLTSGIVYNIWGADNMLEGGADYDFDITMTTNNEYFLKGVIGTDIPVAYEAKKAEKVPIIESELYKTDVLAYNSKIGFVTNCSTTIYEMQNLYEEGSREYKELEYRLKLCCKAQGATIDSAKGIKVKPFPKHWIKFQNVESAKDKERANFDNSLIIEKRPYFMRYLYPSYNNTYKSLISDFDRYCKIVYNLPFLEVKDCEKGYQDVIEYFNQKNPLLETGGIMNKVCRHMESEMSELKKNYKKSLLSDIFDILFEEDCVVGYTKVQKMMVLRNKYEAFKSSKMLSSSPYSTYEQYYKSLRQEALEEISNDLSELANIAIFICYSSDKGCADFVWDCFGRGVVSILEKKHGKAQVPYIKKDGGIDYLYSNYAIGEVETK